MPIPLTPTERDLARLIGEAVHLSMPAVAARLHLHAVAMSVIYRHGRYASPREREEELRRELGAATANLVRSF